MLAQNDTTPTQYDFRQFSEARSDPITPEIRRMAVEMAFDSVGGHGVPVDCVLSEAIRIVDYIASGKAVVPMGTQTGPFDEIGGAE